MSLSRTPLELLTLQDFIKSIEELTKAENVKFKIAKDKLSQESIFEQLLELDSGKIFRSYCSYILILASYYGLDNLVDSINKKLLADGMLPQGFVAVDIDVLYAQLSEEKPESEAFKFLDLKRCEIADFKRFDQQLIDLYKRNPDLEREHVLDFDLVVSRYHTCSPSTWKKHVGVGVGAHGYDMENGIKPDDDMISRNTRKGFGELILWMLEKDPKAAIIAISHSPYQELTERYYIVAIKDELLARRSRGKKPEELEKLKVEAESEATDMVKKGRIMINCVSKEYYTKCNARLPYNMKARKILRSLLGVMSNVKSGSYTDDDSHNTIAFEGMRDSQYPVLKRIALNDCRITALPDNQDVVTHFDDLEKIVRKQTPLSVAHNKDTDAKKIDEKTKSPPTPSLEENKEEEPKKSSNFRPGS